MEGTRRKRGGRKIYCWGRGRGELEWGIRRIHGGLKKIKPTGSGEGGWGGGGGVVVFCKNTRAVLYLRLLLFSYFFTKSHLKAFGCTEAISGCFHKEIRKLLCGYSLLSGTIIIK